VSRVARRSFLERSAAASGAAWLGGSVGYCPWLRAAGADEAGRMAVVGLGSTVKSGGMGKGEVRNFRKIPAVRVVALCDVDSAILGREVEGFTKRNEKLAAAYDRFRAHLSVNGVNPDKTPATLGPTLTFDAGTERFVGEFSEAANDFLSRPYRSPFEVP
jgi:hypothetical protein